MREPSGIWHLVSDDSAGGAGVISAGWSLWIETAPSTAPFPSTVEVSGLPSGITDVDVTLEGLTHDSAADLDVRLVSPSGTPVALMSDAGGGAGVSNATVTLDDEAAQPLPSSAALTSGRFRPANYDGTPGDQAETWHGAAALSSFDGQDPNGRWPLYVDDDSRLDEGRLSGWSLTISTVSRPEPPAIESPGDGSLTREGDVTVTGSAAPGATLLIEGPGGIRFVTADASGWWSVGYTGLTDRGYGASAKVRDRFGNLSRAASITFVVDRQPPQGTVTIDALTGSDERTSRRAAFVHLASTETPVHARLSNDGATWGPWHPIASAVPWTLSDADGVRQVFAQFRDLAGNTSTEPISDSIVLDRRAPQARRVWPVRVRFSEPVHRTYATLSNVVRVTAVGIGTTVKARVSFDASTRTLRVDPRVRLRPLTTYKVVLDPGFRDLAGNLLDGDVTRPGAQRTVWRFTTR